MTDEWHGQSGSANWPLPKLVAESEEANRSDQGNTIKANEYLDSEEVLEAKMETIAKLIKKSKYVTAYTGAGLSRASGIPDYATKAKNSIVNFPKINSSLDAYPTYSHHILKRMHDNGYLQYWVQQNHDGLPQKAGYPQEHINEIHGAWFDPSNRVVQFSGNLRSDLFDDMLKSEKQTDLCLCLGTSLSGMNADRMAKTPAKNFMRKKNKSKGTIIINIQKTSLDSMSTIRVWAKLDDAFAILARKLKIDDTPPAYPFALPPFPDDQRVFWVNYDITGKYDENYLMKLDLSDNQLVTICQPGASNQGVEGEIYKRKNDGTGWTVVLPEKDKFRRYAFGWWMVDAAIRGTLPYLPLMNIAPEVIFVNKTENSKQMFINSTNEKQSRKRFKYY